MKTKQKQQKNRAGNNHPLGAKSKGSNGVVAVGLPHRNYSLFKQAPYQLIRSKEKIRMDSRIREGDEAGGCGG